MHWPAPMTRDGKADKGHDWLDTWKAMEDLYVAYPDKLKAIGKPRTAAWRYINSCLFVRCLKLLSRIP